MSDDECTVTQKEADDLVDGIRNIALSTTGTYDGHSQKTGLPNLPGEVAERIVLALHHQHGDITSLAQTCKLYRTLIYQPLDTFLWREVYLTKYDDPRTIPSHHRLRRAEKFEWGHQYRERIWATNYLRRVPLLESDAENGTRPEEYADETHNLRAILALLSFVEFASSFTVPVTDYRPGGKSYRSYWNSITFERARLLAPRHPVSPDLTESPSLNTILYHKAIAHGIPAALLERLNRRTLDAEWDISPLAQALYKLTTYHALISGNRYTYWEPLTWRPRMPLLVLHKRAYNLSYLIHQRMHGPFVAIDSYTGEEDAQSARCVAFRFRADWSYLAVIAVIMRTVLDSDSDSWMPLYHLGADALRPGAWIPPLSVNYDEGGPPDPNRDWAGVEGIWRRLETWLSFSVLQNEWEQVTESQLTDRARHLVPCRLRVVSYSQDSGCPPEFPTIHFEGETGKERWYEVEERDENDESHVCFVDGQTSMLVDGSVRWSFHMYRSIDKEDGREWSFEGVQIGGIGSIIGIIGVWRGMDSMGFWWQWKVA